MTPTLFPQWWGQVRTVPQLRYARLILAAAAPLERLIREGGKCPLDRALNSHIRSKRMGKNDRALLSLAVYGFARNREGILRALAGSSAAEGPALALGLLDQLAQDQREEAAERFPGAAEARARLQNLRQGWTASLSRAWEQPLPTAEGRVREAMSSLFSVPPFWLDHGPWLRVGEAAAELAMGRFPQKPQLRVNAGRASRGEILGILKEEKIEGHPTPRSPWGIVVEERTPLSRSRVLREGLAEIQDEGSQMVTLACHDGAVGRVLDLCAGAGGKSLALSDFLGKSVLIVAHDSNPGRLAAAKPRIDRSGAKNIRLTTDLEDVRSEAPFDLVLIDAPCSSTGTLRRNPDAAWRWDEDDIRFLSAAQGDLLRLGGGLTRPGGLLIYATCSLLVIENDSAVHEFLQGNNDFHLEAPPFEPAWEEVPGYDKGMMRLPMNLARYEGDGFFLCRMRRRL